MRLERARRFVDDVVRELLAPLLEARTPERGYRLVSWDAEQGICVTLQRGTDVVLVELERRDDARPCQAATGRFNVCARRPFDGAPLTTSDRRAVEQLVAMVRNREGDLPDVHRPATSRRSAARSIDVDRILMPEGNGHYYLNPYVGCTIGCEFCYVADRADLSREIEGLPHLAWGRWVDVKANAPEILRREAASCPPGVVRLSPIVTDPYQPIERTFRITRSCLEILLEHRFTPVVLTRASRVVDDLELLKRFPVAAVGFSIPTDDDAVRRHFEPGGDPIEERLEALRACNAAGLRTFAVIQPVLPMVPERLVELVAPHVRSVRVDRMYEIPRIRHLYEGSPYQGAAEEAFFDRTVPLLRELFRRRGIAADELDDLKKLVV